MSRLSEKEKSLLTHWNYAHRGLHAKDKSVPENSLRAFSLARENGYGAELDVQLSKDGQVVVFHDDDLKRVCGVNERVDAFSYDELHKMKLVGTEETIPLFTDVLEAFYGEPLRKIEETPAVCQAEEHPHGAPLIVELKSAGKKNAELCEKTYEILKRYKGIFCVESFDPQIVYWFRKHAGEIVRGQLADSIDEYPKTGKFMAWMLSGCRTAFLTKPDFVAYNIKAKLPHSVKHLLKQGVMLIGWTSHDQEAEKTFDGVIFEFYHPYTRY